MESKIDPDGPLVELAIEPKSQDNRAKMLHALLRLVQVDRRCSVITDEETGQVVIGGMSEEHLRDALSSSNFGLAVKLGSPQVGYRERLGHSAEIDSTYKAQSEAWGRFARVKLIFEPGDPGSGYRFESRITGGTMPDEFIAGVVKGLAASRRSGVMCGFPVIDFKAILVDGAFHTEDSNAFAFEIAASSAFKEGMMKANCNLVEPIMKLEVAVPAAFANLIFDDLNKRNGRNLSTEPDGAGQVIRA